MSSILEGGKVAKRKKVLTKKQALEKRIGSYYHPEKDKWRSGACPQGKELRKGYFKKSYFSKKGKLVPSSYVDPVCIKTHSRKGKDIKSDKYIEKNYRKEILTEKKAIKKPVGSFYHPTKETYRTGACPVGKILKKGYEKKTSKGKKTYVGPVCVKNKGKPGIEITNVPREKVKSQSKKVKKVEKVIKKGSRKEESKKAIKNSNSKSKNLNKLLEMVEKDGYRSVIMKLSSKLKKSTNAENKKKVESNLKLLRDWRKNNPNKKKETKKKNIKVNKKSKISFL